MRAILFALLTAAAAAAQPPVAPPATPVVTGDLKAMQGFWKPESVRHDGAEKLPADQRALLTLVVKGGEYRMYVASDPKEDKHLRLFTADLAVDDAARAFTLTVLSGDKKGEKKHGVYEFADGKLRLCYGPADKPRPTAFDAPKGADVFLEVWAPEKK